MKSNLSIIIPGITGVLVGAGGIQALHGQAKLPAYLIAEVEVTDAPTYQKYSESVNPIIAKHGGKLRVRSTPKKTVCVVYLPAR